MRSPRPCSLPYRVLFSCAKSLGGMYTSKAGGVVICQANWADGLEMEQRESWGDCRDELILLKGWSRCAVALALKFISAGP